TIIFQPEGTNTAGDLGAAVSVTYQNRNLFHGSELLSVQLRGAFEAITGLEGYQNEDYMEYGVESKISFPRFVAPFLSNDFKRDVSATSELSFSYNMQNRPEFHRRVLSASWRYRWAKPYDRWTYSLNAIDLNYIYMPWISSTFKHEYLDSESNRNAILRYNYEDLFIMRIGGGLTYNNGVTAFKANAEVGGNLLRLASTLMKFKENSNGQYTLFNIAFAQYVKGDFDITRVFRFDQNNSLVFHAGLGMAYPYGNSRVLPFEKRYFSGGANSVRGWSVRGLGPGKFKGHEGAIDFINQTGDMRIDLNLEYRTHLFWKFNGAFFIDSGNIWTLREYEVQPGGQFKLDEFYKQMAVAYGLGVRLNFDYFILRFDMGMKAVNPAYEDSKGHYPFIHPDFGRDFAFHFAVGMPF
ncbi:MAG: BamA/TamA family outer membrane protein, partial [Prevotella sp.]|nr:BamA/TamA family outer membrane protein [Prevotella sp.]